MTRQLMYTTRRGLVLAGLLAGALLFLPATPAGATSVTLTAPAIPGVAPLPGPVAAPATIPTTVGVLTVAPQTGVAGTPITISDTGLPAGQTVTITWSTAVNTWVLDPEPGTVNYLGRASTAENVVLATTTTNSSGAFSVTLNTPNDWGGLHEIYAVVGGVEVASGGLVIDRTATISPTSGPIGTPITITYHGLGASLYEGGGSLLWDNHYVGALTANWTRGTAEVVIRAAGPVGEHTIQIADAITFMYMNIQQSPLPWATGSTFKFRVTKGTDAPKPQIDWPANVAPTISAITTLQQAGLSGSGDGVTASLASTRGPVDTSVALTASGLTPNVPVDMAWATVVGSRVNCTSTCWAFVTTPLGTPTASGSGSLQTSITVPDGLGGWHVVQLIQNGQTKAQIPFYILRSVVGAGVSSAVLKEGQKFTVHLKGLGWTQLDNTIAVDYDNSYIGYGCGFNSNGDTVMNLVATGGPGVHLIDMYPLLYNLSPSFANTPYGMVPFLTYAQDYPGLAVGYQLPAIRLAITIVK
jgi:hypothetical protein